MLKRAYNKLDIKQLKKGLYGRINLSESVANIARV